MGTWGYGPFDDDTALDFVDGLPRAVRRAVLNRRTTNHCVTLAGARRTGRSGARTSTTLPAVALSRVAGGGARPVQVAEPAERVGRLSAQRPSRSRSASATSAHPAGLEQRRRTVTGPGPGSTYRQAAPVPETRTTTSGPAPPVPPEDNVVPPYAVRRPGCLPVTVVHTSATARSWRRVNARFPVRSAAAVPIPIGDGDSTSRPWSETPKAGAPSADAHRRSSARRNFASSMGYSLRGRTRDRC